MTDGAAIERPILWGQVGPPAQFSRPARNNPKVDVPSRGRQGDRLGSRFGDLDDAFTEQATLTQSLGASDPQLVIVFEAIDERADLEAVAGRAGLEILTEVEQDYAPDSDFPRRSVNQDLPVVGCLHAVCVNQQAQANVLTQWRKWQRSGTVDRGYAPLRVLFEHLKDVRAWGPQDRVRATDVAAALAGMLPDTNHTVEIELWYRRSDTARQKAESDVSALISAAGGRVLSTAQVAEVGYHGMRCEIPIALLQSLAAGDYEAIAAVKSAHVMYLRLTTQTYAFSDESPTAVASGEPEPDGEPVLCILDGVPVANHPRLANRVTVVDPDDLAAATTAETALRRHGTAMASVCVWGDLSAGESAASRPVLVRPILTPALDTVDRSEELRRAEMAPDLMRRVFRELYDGDGSTAPTGESVVVINLSVGDPASPFDGVLSSWARTIDWLSANYGVMLVVSAGNHPTLPAPDGTAGLVALNGTDRADAVNTIVAEALPRRSLLSPADSINAVTVGALNADAAGEVATGAYHFDPADGESVVNPSSAIGGGHHRSVKPDLLAPGGRARFTLPIAGNTTELHPATQSTFGPGVKVAAPKGGEAYTVGTSPAAALVSRAAARAVDVVVDLAGRDLTRSELAVATKAFVAHGHRIPSDLRVHPALGPYSHGFGVAQRDLAEGCEAHEASILYVGSLGANEQSTLALPLPNGLQAVGLKRITATLAWLSPVNWRHRQYRRAALDFAKPTGFTDLGGYLDVDGERSKRGTLQHGVWEVNRAVAGGVGSTIDLTVQCREQAGGLNGERVDFAVVLSLWVAPELGVDVYTQVAQQVVAPVLVPATPGVS